MTTRLEDPDIRLIQVDVPTPGASTRVVHFVGGPFAGRRELAGTLPAFHALRARRGRVRRWLRLPRRSAVYLRRDTWFEGRSWHGRYEFDGYERIRQRARVSNHPAIASASRVSTPLSPAPRIGLRQRIGLLFVLVVLVSAAPARATDLPLGPRGLSEARQTRTLAAGATYTDIQRGQSTPEEFFVVDVGLTQDRSQARASAVSLRARGRRAHVLAVDANAPDTPGTGPYYTVRSGRYQTLADAQAAAGQISSEGYADVHADYTGDDGTSTGGPWRLHVLDVDPRRFRGSVAPVLANDVVPGRELVSSIATRTRALAGMNGGYFVIGAADGTPGDLAGLSVIGGDLISEAVNGRTDLLLPRPDGGGARIAPLSTSLDVNASEGASHLLDGRNRAPGLIRSCGGVGGDQPTEAPLHDVTCTDASELIQYTDRFGANADGGAEVEAALDADGRVLALRTPAGGSIPAGGSVLGGTGDGADWLRAHARLGRSLRVGTHVFEGDRRQPLTSSLGVVNGGPRLLAGGANAIDAAQEGFTHPGDPEFFYRFGVRRNPRTLAGVTAGGHLLLVTADGRAPGYSNGLSFAEEAGVMRALGARDAVNLDGGGSTAMALGPSLVTRPSDATGERPVGDAIVLLGADPRKPRGRGR